MSRRAIRILAMALAGLGAACGNETTSPTAESTTPVTTRTLFQGTLSSHDSHFYSFTVTQPGIVQVTLVSLSTGGAAPIAAVMQLGAGVPNGPGCEETTSVTAAPGLTSQLVLALAPGIYCAQLTDVGNLTTATSFVVRIVHP